MRHPLLALAWNSWRLSRRWYLWVLPLAFVLNGMILNDATLPPRLPPGVDEAAVLQRIVGPSMLLLNLVLAAVATLLAVSIGNREGFPLAYEFRLPIRTPLLVAMPMLTLVALCASLYVLPLLAFGLLADINFPLLAPAALIATFVVILLACGWSTTSTTSRGFALLAGILVAAQLFAVLAPIDTSSRPVQPGQRMRFDPDFMAGILTLTPGQYAALFAICALLYALTTASLSKLRCDEAPLLAAPNAALPRPRAGSSTFAALLDRTRDLIVLPCPITAPWRAELWLELKRQVTPILLLAVAVTAAIPLVFALGLMPSHPVLAPADFLFPAIVFFLGIGLAVYNRRQGSAGYMAAFEGTRGMSTLALASIQVLSVAAAALLGISVVCIGLYFASSMLEQPGMLALRLRDLVAARKALEPLPLFTTALSQLVMYLSAVMLLACVHTWSVVWGRWIPYGAGALAIYGAWFALGVRRGSASFDDIKRHMWGFALAVFVLTLLAVGRTLYLKVLSLRSALVALTCWSFFVACTLYSLAQQDIVFTRQASELQAFNAALLVLPLLLFVLLLWSYDRLRHR